ncbi:MAG: Zn-ribbon domain-containing OB-fold protein [Hyphomicrobiales bacterium]|nr:Zn-ribbon domain-containing OB-fold protein [Hyphomicrobiales bacterium]
MSERISVAIELDQSWRYASGDAMARFAEGLVERRIEALKCGGCGKRYLPPRPYCGNCHIHLGDNWVPVAHEGTLVAWTVVYLPFLDGRTGTHRNGPYGMGLIRLDGADTTLNHYLDVADPDQLAVGQRVRAVWREDLRGAIDDIQYFEVLP